MAAKNKVIVRIAGKDYTLVGVESDEYLQKVALYIDKKMNEITRVNSKLSTAMVAVLTAINVADDFFKSIENESYAKNELRQASNELERLKDELERLKEENGRLAGENSVLSGRNTDLQLELAKREAELSEVRNSINTKPGRQKNNT